MIGQRFYFKWTGAQRHYNLINGSHKTNCKKVNCPESTQKTTSGSEDRQEVSAS
jgi:hypothetical protein